MRRLCLFAVVSLVSCVAQTRQAQLRWRTDVAPRVAPGALGPGYEWTDRNAYDGRVNIWRWPVEPGTARVYLYVRDLKTCWRDPKREQVLIARSDGEGDSYEVDARSTGLALDLPPQVWFVFVDKAGHQFEMRDDESLLLLVEPWPEPLRDSGNPEHHARLFREQRNGEVSAQRCRSREAIGQPWTEVPVWSVAWPKSS